MSQISPDLKYAQSHEWARVRGNIATVGVSDYAQRQLTDIVYFEPPKVGATVTAGESCAVVESVKAASDIYAPVSGRVVEVNSELAAHPDWINQSPYEKAWMFKIEMSNPAELGHLLDATQYAAAIKEQ